jgi:phage shock protein E
MMKDIAALIQKGLPPDTLLLDVRTREEFEAGHLPGAHCIPHTLLESRLEELRTFKSMIIYCRVGGRAQFAASVLEDAEFENIYVATRDGFLSWETQGFPIER